MGHTSMCQFHTGWSHFSRLMVTVDYDCVSTKNYDYPFSPFGGTRNGTSGARIKIVRPLFNTN